MAHNLVVAFALVLLACVKRVPEADEGEPGGEAQAQAAQPRREGGTGAASPLQPGLPRQAVPPPGALASATIGVAVPMSGKYKGWGEAIVEGLSLALADSPYQLAVRDTRGEADGAAQALAQLAREDRVIAAVGGVTNAEALAAASAAQAEGVPFISLSKVEGVTAAGPFVFRNMLTAEAQAAALAEFAAARRGLRRFATLYPETTYGQELASAFAGAAASRGAEVNHSVPYEADRTTFSPMVKALVGKANLERRADWRKASAEIAKEQKDPFRRKKALEKLRKELPPIVDFDAVFIPDFAKNVALLAPALAVEDVMTLTCDEKALDRFRKATGQPDARAVQLLGANGWDDPALFEKASRYVECAVFVDGFFAPSARPATRRFVEAFQKQYQHPPTILEASAHDAAGLLRATLEAGAINRDGVRALLTTGRPWSGATGDLSFDPRREPVRQLFFLTADKAGIRELTPQELAAPGAG
ncbi:MAG TPA: penicillin-binding protein activator [Anaeromyxobacteraceae bacterium]|jgi:ABC-type branched-subunit amino acid transport system substrate-binding protein|nr:penicillin-binding protein activator [Anaeromyxobacteraceae bacterium]